MSYVLFYSVFCDFVIFLFNSLHPSNQSSVQKSSAQPFVTEAVLDSISESELTASASLASLQSVTSAITSVIMAMSAAIRSAHEAASSALAHPQASDDVVMVSADPVLIVNGQDQPAIESAEIRTEIAMSGITVSSTSDPSPSLAKYAIMASLPSERMDMCHLSDDVKMFASCFKSASDTFDFKQFMDSKAQRHWFILNEAEFKLWQQHHVLQVPRVKEPSGGHILNWKLHQSLQDAIYHMIYLTVAHCVRHGSLASSADLSATYSLCQGSCYQVTFSSLRKRICSGSSPSTSCQVHLVICASQRSWIRFRSSELSPRCWAAQDHHQDSWHLMSSTMNQSASATSMSAHLSAVSSVTGQRGSMKGSTI